MTAILLSKLGSLLDEDEEQTKSSQVKEALRQVKKVREGEKLGPEGEVGLEANEAEAEEVPDEEEDIVPDEQPDDAWFIPVGWPQRKPREYYRGSDPEWRSFTEFAKNEERGRLVRSELAAIVHAHVSNDKRLQRILGTPISAKKIWLDVDFPYGPPQEYEQWGIEITNEYVAWVSRPVDAINVARLENVLSPMPVLHALWDSYRLLWDNSIGKIRKTLDIEPAPKRFPPGFALPQPEGEAKPTSQKNSSSNTASSSIHSQTSWSKWVPAVPLPGEDYATASKALKATLAKNWKKGMSFEPPRGTIIVSGLVELCGPKGFCVLDVRAAYDPRESQWMVISAGVRRSQPRVQRPKG